MSVSLRDLVATPGLDLRVLAGDGLLDRAVSWVAVSEHDDPTPWLDGGELLLSTGVRLPTRPGAAGLRGYVARLLAAGASGLGFGVGVVHARCPRGLVSACAEAGLPLVEVPRPTPFIAIGKELSRLLDAERAARLTQRLHRMRRLSAAAGSGADALVAGLAGYLDGWCLVLDADGAVTSEHPRGAESRLAGVADGVRRVLAGGLASSASLAAADERVDVLPLGVGGRLSGVLVCGAAGGEAEDRGLVAYAASLLSLGHGRDEELARVRRVARGLALAAVLGGADAPPGVALPWDDHEVRVAALAATADSVTRRLERVPDQGWVVAAAGGRSALAVWRADLHDRAVECLTGTRGGVSDAVALGASAARGLVEAADEAARRRACARERALVTEAPGTLLALPDPAAVATWAQDRLRPLAERADGEELLTALRASLAHPTSTEQAAAAAGVHRHTLRRRLLVVDEALGGDTGDPRQRAELVLALAVLADDAT